MLLGSKPTCPLSASASAAHAHTAAHAVLCIIYYVQYVCFVSIIVSLPLLFCLSCLPLLLYPAGSQQDSPSFNPGPAHDFFLLKGSFSCHCAHQAAQALGFCLCNAPRDSFIANRKLN